MTEQTATGAEHNGAAQKALRILVASYFLAVALRIIPGTDFAILGRMIADPMVANVMTAILVFSLAFMVMIGSHTRLAALLLGLMTVFAAYLTVMSLGPEAGLGAFWRDLALAAALMLTYTVPQQAARRRSSARVTPRRISTAASAERTPRPEPAPTLSFSSRRAAEAPALPTAEVTDFAVARARIGSAVGRPVDLRAPLAAEEIDNIFDDAHVQAR
ncbi:hypothetical protein HKCCE2091_06260 [Rhodobacterales bacterium HKCCE2091]|nr:hypothetical protein [Rhodobacterales bacterium HKCCE2091]